MLKIVSCKCGANVVWVRIMKTNKFMPMNAKPYTMLVETGQTDMQGRPVMEVKTAFTSHFSDCPQAEEFRKREKGTGRTGRGPQEGEGAYVDDTGGDQAGQASLF